MYISQLVGSFFFIFGLCDCFDLDTTECVLTCTTEKINHDEDLCKTICKQDSLEMRVKQGVKGGLPKPVAPRIVGTSWDSIQLDLNTTELASFSGCSYILEVEPLWSHSQKNVNVFTVFPYIEKYYLTNETSYSVPKLEPNTGYKFRVIALRSNTTSEFSDWSNTSRTTKNCSTPPCGVTNMRVELASRVPYKGMARLMSIFYWEPTKLASKYNSYEYFYEFTRISPVQSMCALQFDELGTDNKRKGNGRLREKNIFTNQSLAIYRPEKDLKKTYLYYDCWYTFELYLKSGFFGVRVAERKWIIHTSDCITVNNSEICGCPYIPIFNEKRHYVLNVTVVQSSNTSIAYLNWSDHLWRSVINVTYYLAVIKKLNHGTFHDAYENVHNYNATIPDLKTGELYTILISAYYQDHCPHEKVEKVKFYAKNACTEDSCPENSLCYPDFYAGTRECVCDPKFYLSRNKTRCIPKNACTEDSCPENSLCYPDFYAGTRECVCDPKFYLSRNKTRCIPFNICHREPCDGNQICREDKGIRICDCMPNFVNISGTCEPADRCKIDPTSRECVMTANTETDSKAIIAGIVPALILVILIAVGIIVWLKYFHKKRINFMQREFEDAIASGNQGGTLTNHYDYQHPTELVTLPESSSKEMNLLYVLQEDLVIPEDLKGSIGFFELPGEHVRLRSMIGKGAFGEVYIGEALGIHKKPDWTTVAIKTLAEVVKEEDVYDFLREIELMKDIGKHENVIQMYGCCTRCRPICLVLEYASGGNLLNYLRSLKKKCKEIAAARVYAFMNSEKEKFQKFFEPDEMPHPSTSYSFPYDPYKRPRGSEEAVKEAEALNLEVASKIKEELQTALDPKELESFARQIASGMTKQDIRIIQTEVSVTAKNRLRQIEGMVTLIEEHIANIGIVHRDLAARNILLDENKVLKISDFGLSREGTYVKQTQGKIPFRWLSVEAIVERLYSTASDVWAFGIVLWEICTLGDVPYPTVSDRDLKDFLLSGKRMAKVESCTDDIYEIMLKCWNHLPEDRPSFTELSKCLWDLEHVGNTYVNVESLMKQSVGDQDNENQDTEQKENNNIDGKPDTQLDMTSSPGFDNQGFCLSEEDLNASDDKQLIRTDKKSKTTLDNDAPNGKVGNGMTNETNGSSNSE